MHKKTLNEAGICDNYVTPAITRAGWDGHTQIRREYGFTAGRIIVRGKLAVRGERKRADYLLCYQPSLPLAVVEAKDNYHPVGGEGVKTRLKERLLTECDLHTIVRLPNGVFAPYTNIRTNVLSFAHFDTIAEAPNGIARLRELVLQLAVRGKLVPQAADDEPAGSLLRRLKAGRKRLLAEGVIAKPRHPAFVGMTALRSRQRPRRARRPRSQERRSAA